MTGHPCGALPVSGWSVSVWYCHVHQAYFATQSAYIQRDGDAVELLSADDQQWGPFDSSTAALEYVRQFVIDSDAFEDLRRIPDLDERPF